MPTKAGRKPGRPPGDHAIRQREITNTLLEVIGLYGFDKASLRLVARQAKCTTGVLTHYFRSKEELVTSAVDLLFDWAEQMAGSAANGTDSIKVLQILAGTSDDTQQPPFDFWAVWLQVLAKAKQDRNLAQLVRTRHGRYRALLTKIMKAGQKRGEIRNDIEAGLLADHFNAVSDGLSLMAPIESTRFTKQRTARLILMSIDLLRPASAGIAA
jgi:AcrR family transcriptional regulator